MSPIFDRLGTILTEKEARVQEWFRETFKNSPPFFYTSVDIRHSGYKLAPVDTNLFPAGFNNLSEAGRVRATETAREFLTHYYPGVHSILIVPENHTRNTFYLDNVATLLSIIRNTGVDVQLGTTDLEATMPYDLVSASGDTLTFYPVHKKNGTLSSSTGFTPELIISNNDFTSGTPAVLEGISQPIIPSPAMGWHQRRKTSHFATYNDLARSLGNAVGIDPWLISTVFHKCGVINFKERTGIECVALGVDKVLYRIREKYQEYGIEQEPYVFIKSNKGTYGMGIMTARSGEEVFEMNKKNRTKMTTIKSGEVNDEVIIQEGVPTIDQVDGNPAEHMIYLVAGTPVGCIYRINETRDAYGNLNASGMRFENAAESKETPMCKAVATIARLASAAASWECYEESYQI